MRETTQPHEIQLGEITTGVNLARYSVEALTAWLEANRKPGPEDWGQYFWEPNEQAHTMHLKWQPSEEYKIWQAVQAYVSNLLSASSSVLPATKTAILMHKITPSENGQANVVYTVVRGNTPTSKRKNVRKKS